MHACTCRTLHVRTHARPNLALLSCRKNPIASLGRGVGCHLLRAVSARRVASAPGHGATSLGCRSLFMGRSRPWLPNGRCAHQAPKGRSPARSYPYLDLIPLAAIGVAPSWLASSSSPRVQGARVRAAPQTNSVRICGRLPAGSQRTLPPQPFMLAFASSLIRFRRP